ncbi:ABC transporter permease [Flavimarina sp. Hel_I_48]|uniref:ABC transporter permease n=1 Tax=Flavimarina sp. Hel_I_48 TaxID=1392488 RepID=UPI0004DF9AEB|nr:ABC transporter permease [Flavimarina sp. Hel_I_48]
MIRNYIKIAFRNLWKERTFTSLNILGLSVAFCVAVLLSIYALFELSYDRFHDHADRIYQSYHTQQTPDGAEASISKPIPFAAALKEEVPGIEKITRLNGHGVLVINGEKQLQLSAAYVDPDFFSMFSFPILKGDKTNPIGNKSSVAITEYAAKTIFGSSDPLGKTITVLSEGEEKPFTVSAITENFPDQSSLVFDLVLAFENQSAAAYADKKEDWDSSNHEVYLQLAQGIDPAQFEKATRAFTALHYKDDFQNANRDGIQPDKNGQYIQQRLLNIRDRHFTTPRNGIADVSRLYPYLVLGVAFLILFIASVNFINMSIAKSSKRLREIGMRKTLGANKIQLFIQFWGESVLVFICSALLGILISYVFLESFQTLFSTRASFQNVLKPGIIAGSIVGLFCVTLLAGGYPSFLLSRLRTLQALKGKLRATKNNHLRNTLLVVQFSIAILLICGTLVLYKQLEFMRTKDLGFNKTQVLAFPLNGTKEDGVVMQLLRNELQDKPGIVSVTASNNILGRGKDGANMTSTMGFDYKGAVVTTNLLMVDYDYTKTLDLELVTGRDFNKGFPTDSLGIIVNEAMARQLKEENPLEARITLDDSIHYSVIGVVKDYNFQELSKNIEPLTLFLKPKWNLRYAYVKVIPQNINTSFEIVKNAWKKIEPNAEFQASFLDENIDRTLKRERTMTTMITGGSIIAIILSCIGLFAISLLVVQQRRKEIGIRKVVGASVAKITIMLSMDFLKLVVVAFLIATPIAWYFAQRWLQDYIYRIELSIWVFLGAGALALAIALATISVKTIQAALQNPARSLKAE